jgi:hypothetical protein
MKVKELIEVLSKINPDAMAVIEDGKYNDMQVADVKYVEEFCEDCKTTHNIAYLKMVKMGG